MNTLFALLLGLAPIQSSAPPPQDTVKPDKVVEVAGYTEGVVVDHTGAIYISEPYGGVIHRVINERAEVWARTPAPNGHKILPDGTHLVCDGKAHAVLHLDATGRTIGQASSNAGGQPLRAPNDLTLDADGGFYFTDPGGSSADKPIGTVHYVGRDRRTGTVARGLAFPNGIALRPDGKTLLVAESARNRILAYDVIAPGRIGEMRVFAELPKKRGAQISNEPDGMALDEEGNLYVAHYGMGQVQVVAPDGRLVRTYAAGHLTTSNVAFGGPAMNRLYVTGAIGEEKTTPGGLFSLDLAPVRGLRLVAKPGAPDAGGRPSAEQLARVDAFVLAEQAQQKIPGVALAVIWKGEVLKAQGYGEANVEHHVPVTPDTIFQSGSVGKQFTAAALTLLVEEGRLALEDPLTKFFPGAPASWRGITLRHLLTHTSGIPDYTGGSIDYREDYTDEQLQQLAFDLKPEFAPGARWNYSNTGYVLLGQIIKQTGGVFYGDLLAERVFRPLGMRTARVISEADIVPNRAAGYQLEDGQLKNQDWVAPSLNTTADGALYLSLRDLIAWDRGIRDGRVLKPESWSQMLAPVRLASGRTYPYGFGWAVEERGGHRVFAHGGSWQGFKAYISRYPDDDLSVIVLANLSEADPNAIEAGVTGILNPALKEPELTAMRDDDPSMRSRVQRLLGDAAAGRLRPEDFAYVRAGFFPDGAKRHAERLSKLGAVKRIALLQKKELGDDRVYTYDAEYGSLTLRLNLGLAPDGKIAVFDMRPAPRRASETSAPQAAVSDARADIIGVLQRSAEGWNAGNLDAFMEPYDESATFMTSGGPIDRAATRERYVRNFFAGGRPEQKLTFDELDVRMFGNDVALMTGRFLLKGGAKPDATGRFSLAWRRGTAGWKIVHDHTS